MADYTVSVKITGDSKGFEKAFSTAEKTVATFEDRMKNIGSRLEGIGNGISGFGKKLSVITARFGAAGAAGVKYNATVEQLQTSFERMTESTEDAVDIVSRLKKIGAEIPMEFTDLAETTQLLMNFGFTADEAIESMQMLGDISQGSSEKMGSIARAYGNMSSASKVSLEDINMMIDAGFNPLQEISETTGESMGSLYNRISQGTISVDEITASMQRSTSEGGKYFQSMKKQSETFSGQMSTLNNNVNTFLGNVTGGIFDTIAQEILPKLNGTISAINDGFASGGFQGAIDAVKRMSPVLDSLIGKIETVSGALGRMGVDPAIFAGVVAAAAPLLAVFGKIFSIGGGLLGTVGKLGGVFSALVSPMGIIIAAIAAVAAAFSYLMTTNEGFRNSIMGTVSNLTTTLGPVLQSIGSTLLQLGNILLTAVGATLQTLAPTIAQIVSFVGELLAVLAPLIEQLVVSLAPVLQQLFTLGLQILEMVLPVVADVLSQLLPVVSQIAEFIGNLIAQLVPLISQLIESLMPVIMEIISVVMQIIESLMPPLLEIIDAIMGAVEALMPPIMHVVEVVVDVVGKIMEALMPIITFVGDLIAKIIEYISPIISFIAGVISKIVSFVTPLIDTFAEVFGGIFDVVSDIMGGIGDFIGGIFNGIESAWNGLKGFVSGIFDGISGAFDALVGVVKGVINGVIGAINGAIWVINLIPGVEIGEIPYLAHGIENWQGGFAYMNEGGRGELTYLPNGAQVIPHDISVKYAKESARANAKAEPLDLDGIMEGMVIQVINHTSVDGTPLKETISDYTIRKIGNQQRAILRAKGAY